MTNGRRPITGRDAAGAGALMVAANVVCAGAGAGLGALAGAAVPGLLIGFGLGFFVAIAVVIKLFSDP